ncbi:replication protein [uncultured Roseobacter sp.]|uniref:replication protein n=1 Tax=uncultured Roseobacter sp. TaxID=114847 RepID=UPI0026397651|nr:replication protein [uncultured Roseobacter sp.]
MKLKRSLLSDTKKSADSGSSEETNTVSSSLAVESPEPASSAAPKPRTGGAGSAWKAGAVEQNKAALIRARQKVVDDILNGRHELSLNPALVTDSLGSDRRADWQSQEPFQSLRNSIEGNGQDTPIQVWPSDPNWKPDPLDPENVDGVQFDLITGRRRHAIAESLGRPLRAVLASPEKRGSEDETFELLFMRFRENEERENLGPFERLLSIGEMFENLKSSSRSSRVTAVSFAERIGVHESIVSRGRAVFRDREQILNKFKNAYDLSFPDLQKAVSSLTETKDPKAKAHPKPKKLTVTRSIGSRKLSMSSQGGKLSVSAAGLNLDKQSLEGLGDVIAAYLQEHGSKK